jgi:hypothetical protein
MCVDNSEINMFVMQSKMVKTAILMKIVKIECSIFYCSCIFITKKCAYSWPLQSK